MPDFPIVEVRWVDPATFSGWRHPEDDNSPGEIRGFGFLVKETDEYVVICGHVSAEGRWMEPISIPRGVIRKMWTIEL